jgi:hypothetical protein
MPTVHGQNPDFTINRRNSMKTIVALCLVALPAFAAPPDPEMDTPTTRDGYKARNERHVSHENTVFKGWATGPKFEANGGRSVYMDFLPIGTPKLTGMQYMTCQADVVAVVSVYNQRPVLSQGENFVWTEYKVEVNEVLRGHLAVGARTTIAYPGGEINLPGDHLAYRIQNYMPLLVGGQYVAFLKYLPATNDFTPANMGAVYSVEPGGFSHRMVEHAERETGALAAVRAATQTIAATESMCGAVR